MEAEEVIFKGVSALWLADTGTGGLGNSASAAFVREFHREGSPQNRQVSAYPNCEVRIKTADISPLPGTTETFAVFDGVVTFIVETDRCVEDMLATASANSRAMDRVASRIRVVFNNVAPANVTDSDETSPQRTWKFRPMWRLAVSDVPSRSPTGKTLRRAFSYRVCVSKESA